MTERLHYSTLKRFATSALAFKAAQQEDAAHLRKGSAVHALVYGDKRVAVYDGVRRGKEWEAWKVANAGAVQVNETERAAALPMAEAVRGNAVVRRMGLLTHPDRVVERELLWELDGIPFSSTPDLHCPDFCMDLKTTKFAKPSFFQNEIIRYHYHCQAVIYRRAIKAVFGYEPKHSYIVAVESKAPHDVVVFKLAPSMLLLAEKTVSTWMEQYRQCRDADVWPGYSDAVVEVEAPEWAVDEDEEEDEDE